MELTNKKILITGGSAGIGKAIANELIEKGASKIAVMGRTAEKLDTLEKEFPSAQILKIQGDVSQVGHIKLAVNKIDEEWGALDILINNAGVVSAGLLEDISDSDIEDQINVNVTGLILMTKYFLPFLKESREAALINVSSGLGYIAMPFYSVYAASKSAVKHFTEAMRRELAQYPIHALGIYPTATDTKMMETAKVEDMDSPEIVARATIEGLLNGENEVVLGGQQRIEQIEENFNEPTKVDEKVKEKFKSLAKRAKDHRSI